jgi:hypothetical protein
MQQNLNFLRNLNNLYTSQTYIYTKFQTLNCNNIAVMLRKVQII